MQVSIIVFPGTPILTYALIREVLTLANRCSGRELFNWQTRTVTGQEIDTLEGIPLAPSATGWDGAEATDLVLLCAGARPLRHLPFGFRGFLARADKASSTLGAIGPGTVVLAELGLLNGREAVLEDAEKPEHQGRWPQVAHSDAKYCLDRERLTAGSGMAGVDALLAWVARTVAPSLSAQISEALALGRLAVAGDSQKLPRASDPVLMRMQAVMAANLENPIPLDAVARELDLSPKQMRTRCQHGLGQTPMQAYLELRLTRAKTLVQDTELSVQEIAAATGFVSPSAFTRSYRALFGETPRTNRAARRH
ncbi:GlxA family transcriptional regulator [Primorskyibacter sp. 2E233]|uniref:GlxA family transcriptional regulator n=1 Tax=Primorskyibacter sp. 2E233 TaxID=3413431 RepID=UPI003BF112F8